MKSLFVALLAILMAGCASTEKHELRLNLAPTAENRRITFPPISDAEVPRYVYVGELLGEQNFVLPEGRQENPLMTAWRWIAGLFDTVDPLVLQRPQFGAVDELGRIMISDVSRGAIYVFDENKGELDTWEYGEGLRHFISPVGIALGPEGKIFVSDAELRRIFLLDREGKGIGVIGKDQLKRPTGLAWDPDAALLYVSDTGAHQIKVFDMTGSLVRTIGERGVGPGQFNFPTHLAMGQGKLIVADTMNARVQVLTLDGSLPPLIVGERGTQVGNLVRPKGVATDSEGNIYVVESYHDHLLVYDRKGRFLMPIGGTGKTIGEFYLPGGVWVDSGNRIYVADTFNGRIVIFQFLGGGAESEQ